MTRYLVYRHGSNGANQSGLLVLPVAIVEAPSAQAACETVPRCPGTAYATECLRLAPAVHAYSGQHFSARPVSRAPALDVRRVQAPQEERP